MYYREIGARDEITAGTNVVEWDGHATGREGVVMRECPSKAYVVVLWYPTYGKVAEQRTWPVARLMRAETPAEVVARLARWEDRG